MPIWEAANGNKMLQEAIIEFYDISILFLKFYIGLSIQIFKQTHA